MSDEEKILLILASILGLIILTSLVDISELVQSNLDTRQEVKELKCPSEEITSEDMYIGLPKPEIDEIVEPGNIFVPEYRVKTNSHNLRDQNFSIDKPENQFRVLVVGDEMTYGLGINESDRFTEVLERRINKTPDREVRVINAGIPGAGMKDYYQFMLNIGMDFNPDLVIVAFGIEDITHKKMKNRFIREEKEKRGIPENVSIYTNEEAASTVDDRKRNYIRNAEWFNSTFREYMSKLLAMNEAYNFDLYMYRLFNTSYDISAEPVENMTYDTAYDYWREECDENIITHSPEIEYSPTYAYYPDPYFNPKGNKVIGEWLYKKLEEKALP